MFIHSWGDISMALLCAMTCLACTLLPRALRCAEKTCPPDDIQQQMTRRMRWSAWLPDVSLDASYRHHTHKESVTRHQAQRAPTWRVMLVWDVARIMRRWRRQLSCTRRGLS